MDSSTLGQVIFMPAGSGSSGVENITENADAVPVMYVQPSGIMSNTPVKGLNIVKMSDGTTRKIIVK